jgi:hypothetical protein
LPIAKRTSWKEKKHSNEDDGEEAAEDEPGLETTWSGHRFPGTENDKERVAEMSS